MTKAVDAIDTLIMSKEEMAVRDVQERRHSYLAGLPTGNLPDQTVAPEVADLAHRREQTIITQTLALHQYVAQHNGQEPPQTFRTAVAQQERMPIAPVAPPSSQSVHPTAIPQGQPSIQKQRESTPRSQATNQKNVQKLAPRFWHRRVPVCQQMEAAECGAACLAMILNYYGRETSVAEIRAFSGVGRDGLSALSIAKTARAYGMRVRAISLKENNFSKVSLPAIVHWEFNHFVVVEYWSPTSVEIVDPEHGRRRITAEEFDQSFTGIVLMLEPGVQFKKRSSTKSVRLRSYLLRFLKMAPFSLVQLLGASLLLQGFGLAMPVLTKIVIDQIIPLGWNNVLPLLGIGLLILLVSQTVTTLLRSSVLLYLQTRVDIQMMLSFFEQLLHVSMHFFQQRSSGDLMARLSSNTIVRDTFSTQLISTILDGSFVLVYFVILLSFAPLFALLTLGIGLAQMLLLWATISPLREVSRRELVAQGKSQSYLAEALAGMATLKAAGSEQRAMDEWSNLFFEQMNCSVRRSYLSSVIGTGMQTLSMLAPLALLWLGTYQVLSGQLQVGTMLALNALAIAFLTPLSSLVASGQQFQVIRVHLERIADVMEAEPEQDTTTAHQPPRLSGMVRLEGVAFQYDPQVAPILHDINLSINPGQKVAIVGRTGSGKTTLGKLLLGMYLPTQGTIFYNGIPLPHLNYQAVRSQFGVVMQDTHVFSGSIRHNICFSDPTIMRDRMIQAARLAALHEDIMKMPMEYETHVSEGGAALSGGQRQRLALARALVHAPALLLLDEATSSLDVATEQAIEQNLSRLPCTQIIIAHRLSTVRNADLILVLDQGTLVERGSHEELLKQNGYYARLIQHQLTNGEMRTQ